MSFRKPIKCKGCGKEFNPNSGLISTSRKLCRIGFDGGCDKKFWRWWDSIKSNPKYNHIIYNTETMRVNYWRDNVVKGNGGKL